MAALGARSLTRIALAIAVAVLGGCRTRPFAATADAGAVDMIVNSDAGACAIAFAPPISTPLPVHGTPSGVALGDLDGDGRLDAVVADRPGGVAVLLGVGDGTFRDASAYVFPGLEMTGVTLADLDGDGHLDVAAALALEAPGAAVFHNAGDGKLTPVVFVPTSGDGAAIAAADYDGDGVPDVALVWRSGGSGGDVTVYPGRGDGTLDLARQTVLTLDAEPVALASGDLDGDGVTDLAVSLPGAQSIALVRGGAIPQLAGSAFVGMRQPFGIALADLRRRGTLDLVAGTNGEPDDSLAVLLGDGNAQFAAPTFWPAGMRPIAPVAAPLGCDGAMDLAGADLNADTVAVLAGHGDGSFGAALLFAAGPSPIAIAAGDLDGDGALDLIVANDDTALNEVSVLLRRTR